MKHSSHGKIVDLAKVRIDKTTSNTDPWELAARSCAELLCSRLTEVYGGRGAALETLERTSGQHQGPGSFRACYSAAWADGRAVHRAVTITLTAIDQPPSFTVENPDGR